MSNYYFLRFFSQILKLNKQTNKNKKTQTNKQTNKTLTNPPKKQKTKTKQNKTKTKNKQKPVLILNVEHSNIFNEDYKSTDVSIS